MRQIAPGLKGRTHGRLGLWQNDMTPEQRSQLRDDFVATARAAPDRLLAIADALETVVKTCDTTELLMRMTVIFLMKDPDTYKEYETEHSAVVVEYVQWLALHLPKPIRARKMEPSKVQEVVDLLDEAQHIATVAILHDHIVQGRPEPTLLDELRQATRLSDFGIRSPGFPEHALPFILDLFAKHGDELLRLAGFTAADAVALLRALPPLPTRKFNKVRLQLHRQIAPLTHALASGKLDQQIGANATNADERRNNAAMWWLAQQAEEAFAQADELMLLNAEELAAAAALPIDRARGVLNALSLQFGLPWTGDRRIGRSTQLSRQPFVRYPDNRYFIGFPEHGVWGLRQRLEEILKTEPRSFERYQSHRSRTEEDRVGALFARMNPGGIAAVRLKYVAADGRPAELDCLSSYGRTLYLVESKASQISEATRRGAETGMQEDLREVVGKAHDQALRARAALEAAENVTFTPEAGPPLVVRRADYDRIFMVTVSLDPIDMFALRLGYLHELGVLRHEDLPWAVGLGDLEVIADLLEWPWQLSHYLRLRIPLQRTKVFTMDELDLFGCYQFEGLAITAQMQTGGRVQLLSYTTGMDDYYLFRSGARNRPAPRPAMKLPSRYRKQIRQIPPLPMDEAERAGHSILDSWVVERERATAAAVRQMLKDAGVKVGVSLTSN